MCCAPNLVYYTHIYGFSVFLVAVNRLKCCVLIVSSEAKSVDVVCCVLNSDSCLIVKLCSTEFCFQCKWRLKLLYCCSLHNCEFYEYVNIKCLSSIHLSQNFPKSFSKILFGLRKLLKHYTKTKSHSSIHTRKNKKSWSFYAEWWRKLKL